MTVVHHRSDPARCGVLALFLCLPGCSIGMKRGSATYAIPTVSEAIVQSMTLVRGHGVFQHPVVVSGSRLEDGSVRVRFARPVKEIPGPDAHREIRRILHVDFTHR